MSGQPNTAQAVTLQWVGPYTVKIDPPVPAGKVLTIYRDTPKDAPLVTFTDDAVLNEADLATNAKQAVFVAAEMVDRYGSNATWFSAIETLNAAITQEPYIRQSDLAVEAGLRTALEARVNTLESNPGGVDLTAVYAAITNEATIRANAISAEAAARTTLASRVTTTENDLSGITTRMNSAEAAITSEAATRAAADIAEASARTALTSRVTTLETGASATDSRLTTAEAAIANEATTRAAGDSANASQITSLTARVSTLESSPGGVDLSAVYAAISEEASVRASQDSALASQVSTVSATVTTKIRTFYQATAPTASNTGDMWYSTGEGNKVRRWNGTFWEDVSDTRIAALNTQVSTLNSNVYTNNQARIDGDAALAAQINSVDASWQANNLDRYNDFLYVNGRVDSEVAARASAIAAEASSRETVRASLQSQLDGVPSQISGAVSVEASARVSAINAVQGQVNNIQLRYAVSLDSNGVATGFELIGGGGYTVAKWKVSYFSIVGPDGNAFEPFSVDTVNNRVNMTNVYVQKLYADAVMTDNLVANAALQTSVFTIGSYTGTGASNKVDVLDVNVYAPVAGTLLVQPTLNQSVGLNDGSIPWTVEIFVDGVSAFGAESPNHQVLISPAAAVYVSAGTHNVKVRWSSNRYRPGTAFQEDVVLTNSLCVITLLKKTS